MNPYASYWQTGQVPHQTGAEGLEDLRDFDEWCAGTGFSLTGRVLDIGCGTGRLSQRCTDYIGVDVAGSQVDYARRVYHANAQITETPDDLPEGPFDRVCVLSVFTHIAREDRQAYLAAIRQRLDGEALIDILPGTEGGGIGAWYADLDGFRDDLADASLQIVSEFEWIAKDQTHHRYFRLR